MAQTSRAPVDVVSAAPLVGSYVLLTFSDGVQLPVNLRRFMRGPIFEDVLANGTFLDFKVDKESGTLVWPNGADLDPEVLRYTTDDVRADANIVQTLTAATARSHALMFRSEGGHPKRLAEPTRLAGFALTHVDGRIVIVIDPSKPKQRGLNLIKIPRGVVTEALITETRAERSRRSRAFT